MVQSDPKRTVMDSAKDLIESIGSRRMDTRRLVFPRLHGDAALRRGLGLLMRTGSQSGWRHCPGL